jgi:hypothetical protein
MTNRIRRSDGDGRDGHETAAGSPDEKPLAVSRRDTVRLLGSGVALGGLATAVPVAADIETPTALQVDGNRITTADGTPITLRGINTIDPKRANATASERSLDAVGMIDRVTDSAAGWEPRVLRIPVQPVDIGDYEPGQAPEPVAFTRQQLEAYLETHLDPVVQRCVERGVYAIVDFHRHWPGIEWGDERAGTINQPLQDEAMIFWNVVAPRYADDEHVIYELYNEPTEPGMWGSPEEEWVQSVWYLYLQFAQPIVDTIRAHTEKLVLVGSPGWSQSPEGALIEPIAGENIAYTYHIYPGHEVSKQGAWDDASINGEGVANVYEEFPLFVTEFGWRDTDDRWLGGTTSEFGEPFVEWLESSDAINWTAWCGDIWWEPALFTDDGDDWALLGRDAGTLEDAGEYVRQALATGGVPADYWNTDDSTDDGSTDDGSTDDGSTDDGSTDDGSTDDEESSTDKCSDDSHPGRGKGR